MLMLILILILYSYLFVFLLLVWLFTNFCDTAISIMHASEYLFLCLVCFRNWSVISVVNFLIRLVVVDVSPSDDDRWILCGRNHSGVPFYDTNKVYFSSIVFQYLFCCHFLNIFNRLAKYYSSRRKSLFNSISCMFTCSIKILMKHES